MSTYAILNSPSSTEPQIEGEIERIANGLFSAVATTGLSFLLSLFITFILITLHIGHVPFIRAPRGNAAEMIAKKLETKIRDAILSASRTHASSTSLFAQDSTGLSSLQRPRKPSFISVNINPYSTNMIVLLILDRNMDFVSMLAHGWTYQALVSDCLDMKLNRVLIAAPDKPKKSYDLDSKDFFWAHNAANPFPQVAEEIDAELNKYKQDAAEITRSTGVSNVNDIAQL